MKYILNMANANVFGYAGLRMLGQRAQRIGVDLYTVDANDITEYEKFGLERDGVEVTQIEA